MTTLASRGFLVGATVRQYNTVARTVYSDATIRVVHPNGALDVVSVKCGTRWGWSADHCEVVAPPPLRLQAT